MPTPLQDKPKQTARCRCWRSGYLTYHQSLAQAQKSATDRDTTKTETNEHTKRKHGPASSHPLAMMNPSSSVWLNIDGSHRFRLHVDYLTRSIYFSERASRINTSPLRPSASATRKSEATSGFGCQPAGGWSQVNGARVVVMSGPSQNHIQRTSSL